MTTFEIIKKKYPNASFSPAVGFDDCIIGVSETDMRLIYSVEKCMVKLELDGMTREDVKEFFRHNMAGHHIGGSANIWCDDTEQDGGLDQNANFQILRAGIWMVKNDTVSISVLKRYFTEEAIESLIKYGYLKQIYEQNG